MRTAGARARRGAGPGRGGRGRDSSGGPGAHEPKPPTPSPLPACTHPHRGSGAGPASTPRGDHYITPRPAAPSPPPRAAPSGARGAGAPGTWPPGVGAGAAAVFIFRGRGGRRRARSERRLPAPPPSPGLLGGSASARAAALFGSALGSGELRARRPGRASAARCESAAPAWLSARASSVWPLGAGAAAGGGLGGWGRRSGRGHREEVSVPRRLLLSPLFAPASLWR